MVISHHSREHVQPPAASSGRQWSWTLSHQNVPSNDTVLQWAATLLPPLHSVLVCGVVVL